MLVVTHLPQVAAYADAQVQVAKHSDDEATVSRASVLDPDERVIELSRMLSGQPDSDAARTHAAELLAARPGDRGAPESAARLGDRSRRGRGRPETAVRAPCRRVRPGRRPAPPAATAARDVGPPRAGGTASTGRSPASPASTGARSAWSSASSPATSRSSTTRTSTGWPPRRWSTPAPVAVVNAAASISGRYPNLGPLLLCQAGIPLVDDVGPR